MIERIKEIIARSNKLVLLPKSDELYYDCFNYMFGDCIVRLDENFDNYNELSSIINENIEEFYFVNFQNVYRKLLPNIGKKVKKINIFLCDVANFTSVYVLPLFYDVSEFYERKLIDKICILNNSVYEMMKKKFNVEKLNIKLPFNDNINDCSSNKSIGIIGNDYDPVHNFYNMLTAVSMVNDYDVVKFVPNMNATREFFNHFDIKHEFCNNLDEVMNNNFVNLYCNFTNTNPCLVIKSMDMGIPCLLGNTDLFDNNKKLKELLVLKSDDDVNEIAFKINNIRDNYDVIFKEYKKWRRDYL